MKILVLCCEDPFMPVGGRGTLCRYQNPELGKLGAEIRYVSLIPVSQPTFYLAETPAVNALYRANDQAYGDLCGNLEKFLVHCARFIAQGWWPDLIVAHDWDMISPALRLREIFGIPVAAYFHLFQKQVERIRPPTLDDVGLAPGVLERVGCERADRVLVVSEALKSFALSEFHLSRRIDVVTNAVDYVGWSNPGKSRPATFDDRPIVAYIGRLAPEKGWPAFLEASKRDDRFNWLMIGAFGDDDNEPPEIQELRAPRDNFAWIGYQTEAEIRNTIGSFSAVVMPSVIEPWGIVALEAMAAGVPLLTTRVDGLREFCDDSNSIEIDSDPTSILNSLAALRADPELGRRRVEGGRLTAQSHSWAENARAVMQIYKGMI
jgi:glycogen synthase